MGIFCALASSAWLGHPATRAINPIEIGVIIMLVGISLFTAWRFYKLRGWIAGPILLVAVVVEVAKRIASAFQGVASFGIADLMIALLIIFGLVNGIRSARAVRDLLPQDTLKKGLE